MHVFPLIEFKTSFLLKEKCAIAHSLALKFSVTEYLPAMKCLED